MQFIKPVINFKENGIKIKKLKDDYNLELSNLQNDKITKNLNNNKTSNEIEELILDTEKDNNKRMLNYDIDIVESNNINQKNSIIYLKNDNGMIKDFTCYNQENDILEYDNKSIEWAQQLILKYKMGDYLQNINNYNKDILNELIEKKLITVVENNNEKEIIFLNKEETLIYLTNRWIKNHGCGIYSLATTTNKPPKEILNNYIEYLYGLDASQKNNPKFLERILNDTKTVTPDSTENLLKKMNIPYERITSQDKFNKIEETLKNGNQIIIRVDNNKIDTEYTTFYGENQKYSKQFLHDTDGKELGTFANTKHYISLLGMKYIDGKEMVLIGDSRRLKFNPQNSSDRQIIETPRFNHIRCISIKDLKKVIQYEDDNTYTACFEIKK